MARDEQRTKRPLILLGSGEYSYSLYEAIGLAGPCEYELRGFAQNIDPERKDETFAGYPVYPVEELEPLAATHEALCVLGDGAAKREFVRQVEPYGFRFASLRSAMTRFSERSTMGEGGYLGWSVTVASGCEIGNHVTIVVQSVLGESVTLEDYVFCGAGVRLTGGCHIGEGAFIGTGAIVRDRVKIGRGAVVGIGAVVVKDVPEGATVVGNPARIIERKGGLFRHP